VTERERSKETERGRERKRQIEREIMCVCARVCALEKDRHGEHTLGMPHEVAVRG